jgi:hypothetical protein
MQRNAILPTLAMRNHSCSLWVYLEQAGIYHTIIVSILTKLPFPLFL